MTSSAWDITQPAFKYPRSDSPETGDDNEDVDIFTQVPWGDTSATVKRNYSREYRSMIPSDGPIGNYQFTVNQRDEEGTDLQNCFVEVDLQVFKENGKSLTKADGDKIVPANDLFNALFGDVSYSVTYSKRLQSHILGSSQTESPSCWWGSCSKSANRPVA